ncbi:hypothetical protein DENSPDRAFT_653625 [Dentipellis sp. KUC8613]|nr:hypothetical protein DENSPDRAFT_653625 [Dentipellis sp. KUC8613]
MVKITSHQTFWRTVEVDVHHPRYTNCCHVLMTRCLRSTTFDIGFDSAAQCSMKPLSMKTLGARDYVNAEFRILPRGAAVSSITPAQCRSAQVHFHPFCPRCSDVRWCTIGPARHGSESLQNRSSSMHVCMHRVPMLNRCGLRRPFAVVSTDHPQPGFGQRFYMAFIRPFSAGFLNVARNETPLVVHLMELEV